MNDLDDDVFDEMPREKFLAELKATRDGLASENIELGPQEPFALVHGDFCGRNIMIHDGHVKAVLDWEFAGSYPLSEILGGIAIEVFELEDENLLENEHWSDVIRDKIVDRARDKGWQEERIQLLVGEGNGELQLARREMVPMGGLSDDGNSAEGDEDVSAAEDLGVDVVALSVREHSIDEGSHLD